MNTEEYKGVFRTALTTFLALSAIIYIGAMIYSIATNHATAAILLSVGAVLVALLATWMIRSEA